MVRTIDWINYDALFSVMTAHGFVTEKRPDGGLTLRHPHGEILPFPLVQPTDQVITYHYGMVRAAMSHYEIMTTDAFDLALLQAAHRLPTPV